MSAEAVPLCRLIVLALKHFEGTLETDQLISSYLLCKSRWSIRKHIREMSMAKVPPSNVIKVASLRQSQTHQLSTRESMSCHPFTLSDIHNGGFCPATASFLQPSSARRAACPGGPGHCQLTEMAQG